VTPLRPAGRRHVAPCIVFLLAVACYARSPSLTQRLQAQAPSRNSVVVLLTPSCAIRTVPAALLAALDSLDGVAVLGLYLATVEPDSGDVGTQPPELGFALKTVRGRDWLPSIEAEGYALPLAAIFRHGRLVAVIAGEGLARLGSAIPTAFGVPSRS